MGRKVLMALMGLEIGGAETHVVELSKELKRKGWDVDVVSNGGVYEAELEKAGVRCFRAPLNRRRPLPMLSSLLALRKIIRERSCHKSGRSVVECAYNKYDHHDCCNCYKDLFFSLHKGYLTLYGRVSSHSLVLYVSLQMMSSL